MITVSIKVNGSLEKIWDYFTNAEHIIHWNFASEDWCTPWAKNDLRVGGEICHPNGSKGRKFRF